MKKILAFVFCFGFIFSIVCTPFIVMADDPPVCVDGVLVSGTGPCPRGGGDTGLSGGTGNVTKLFSFLGAGINAATKLILGAAVVFFLWGVFQFVRNAGNEEAQTEGKSHIIYGIIGIAVMVSMWGLVAFLTGSAQLDDTEYIVPRLLPMPD